MRIFVIIFITAVQIISPSPRLQAQDIIDVGKFSAAEPGEKLPEGWHPLIFKNITSYTRYSLVKDGDTVVVKAVSEASASGLIRKIRIDPQKYPIIQWRWKVMNVCKNSDVTQKDGNDYPARIYITFEHDPGKIGFFDKVKYYLAKQIYGEYPPICAINYIWESKAPIGTIAPDPYTERNKMIVVESGEKALDTWITEERNILADFVAAFGETPPMISGIGIMTDSDNTKESDTAFYGDILLKQK
jgi:hypothetical protein